MFKNYLKIAVRNFLKHKAYSFINIAGLALGLAACILILLYVRDEINHDRYHKNADRIYRVTTRDTSEDRVRDLAYSFAPLAPALLTDIPDISHAVRFFPYSAAVKATREKCFQEDRFFFVDPEVFEVFTFPLKKGNPETVLKAPFSIVITEETAEKYFAGESALGKTLNVEGKFDFKVTGILENVPDNSHFTFDFLVPMDNVEDVLGWKPHWYWPPMYTYILLPGNYPASRLEDQFPGFLGKHIGKWAKGMRKLRLQPLTSIYLHSNLESEIEPTGNIAYVYIFSSIALFILFLACINFMNLATARSERRAREVGMRKVMGAQRFQLTRQFFGESLFYAFVSLFLAVVLVELLLPLFNRVVEKQLSINYMANWAMVVGFIALTFLVGIVSGSYPAFYLSRFQPLKALQGKTLLDTGGRRSLKLRTVLVTFQFSISIILVISTVIVRNQVNYIRNKDLGFDKKHFVLLPVRDEQVQENLKAFKTGLLSNSNIRGVTGCSSIPSSERLQEFDFPIIAEGVSGYRDLYVLPLMVDYDFVKTFGMEIAVGRDFSKDSVRDAEEAFILNETAVKKLGWESPIGKRFEMDKVLKGKPKTGRIIGVVNDFHFNSFHQKIGPVVIQISPEPYYYDFLAVRISSQNIPGTLEFIKKKWNGFIPHRPFEYSFLDSEFEKIYRKEMKLGQIFSYFAGFA
ncbi:MAG: FtsX-like permease family protein, partial [bacterium]|nr:FtsX-like permease family protein [bacterium]